MTDIKYLTDVLPLTADIISVYDRSGINRPTGDSDRITKMYTNSNLIATAWSGNKLVGIARSLTDFCYVCYLSDLAVDKEFQKAGIGNALIALTKKEIGSQTSLILLSAPTAMEYYPKIGFEEIKNGFIKHRLE